ncbi:glycosyltransferase [Arthrobacter citreus]|uniref:Glycosyltransferase n=1 Tax=Arthrobacter citreus TaxID=1670 RepID=A0ABZ2ZR69_9MICC
MRILHVTECYEGGVRRAIETMVRLTPELEHFLLADGEHLGDSALEYSGTIPLAKGFIGRSAQVKAVAEDFEADLIHAHSSWAGAYARVGTVKTPVVYEPHCFVFDDPHRGRLLKWVYRKAEIAMGKNTAAVIALSPHERQLAENVISREQIVWLPNVPSIPTNSKAINRADLIVPEIVMVGRLARQKDPLFFASVYESLKEKGIATKFTWIGDGETQYHKSLNDRGVEVTGWLNDIELVERLSHASLYFHSASYEGFPLSVLDAAAAGLPVLARDLPSFRGFPVRTAANVEDAANKIVAYLRDPDVRNDFLTSNNELLTMMTPEAQRASLYRAYEIASRKRKEMLDCV